MKKTTKKLTFSPSLFLILKFSILKTNRKRRSILLPGGPQVQGRQAPPALRGGADGLSIFLSFFEFFFPFPTLKKKKRRRRWKKKRFRVPPISFKALPRASSSRRPSVGTAVKGQKEWNGARNGRATRERERQSDVFFSFLFFFTILQNYPFFPFFCFREPCKKRKKKRPCWR